MNTATLIAVAIGAIGAMLVYVLIVRPILVHAPILSEAFKAEASLFDKSRAKLAGWKTKIASRLVVIGGGTVGLYDMAMPYVSTQNWTPVTQRLPDWAIPVGMVAIGVVFSWLRHVTENPPQVVTQKMDDGTVQIVAVNPPGT